MFSVLIITQLFVLLLMLCLETACVCSNNRLCQSFYSSSYCFHAPWLSSATWASTSASGGSLQPLSRSWATWKRCVCWSSAGFCSTRLSPSRTYSGCCSLSWAWWSIAGPWSLRRRPPQRSRGTRATCSMGRTCPSSRERAAFRCPQNLMTSRKARWRASLSLLFIHSSWFFCMCLIHNVRQSSPRSYRQSC